MTELQEELQQQTHRALLIFCALSKVQNESYTRFLGMFKHSDKQKFNELIKSSNMFCKTIETNFPEDSIKSVNSLEEYFQDFIFSLVKRGDFTLDSNTILTKKLNDMLEEPEVLEYDIFSIKHVLRLLDKTKA
ncbi:hypothetical protein [uncultured Clostridium sp.]|uniref:hypothetical protein n=1 Tax=uncultured Clostridium sp. TaxID=59620 RepID=UPI00263060E3|nr:hypothetical protein [uncultured Clostridium sp.]